MTLKLNYVVLHMILIFFFSIFNEINMHPRNEDRPSKLGVFPSKFAQKFLNPNGAKRKFIQTIKGRNRSFHRHLQLQSPNFLQFGPFFEKNSQLDPWKT